MTASNEVEPFHLSIAEEALSDLKQRLAMTRLPDASPLPGWQQGVPLVEIQNLRDYWIRTYDWRRCEKMLNDFGQFRTVIDGVGIHFLHIRSPEPNALPLILTHGWPGSVVEFWKVIGPLTDPRSHGGKAEDAFHLVVPSLPGYGFSDAPPNWDTLHIAKAWRTLMARLGYARYVAQGGDWGAAVTAELAALEPPQLAGIHLNLVMVIPDETDLANLTETEKEIIARNTEFNDNGQGYADQQRTKPQTLGYALADSPIGQAAWIYDKYRDWSDCDGDPRNTFSMDEMLDNIMMYWLPNRSASSARLYAAVIGPNAEGRFAAGFVPLSLPVGVTMYPKEVMCASRRWVEKTFSRLIYWNEPHRGGHFAAFERPASFVTEMRDCFCSLR